MSCYSIFMRVYGQSSCLKQHHPLTRTLSPFIFIAFFFWWWNVNTIFLHLSNSSRVFYFLTCFLPCLAIYTFRTVIFSVFLFYSRHNRLIDDKKESAQIKVVHREQGEQEICTNNSTLKRLTTCNVIISLHIATCIRNLIVSFMLTLIKTKKVNKQVHRKHIGAILWAE